MHPFFIDLDIGARSALGEVIVSALNSGVQF